MKATQREMGRNGTHVKSRLSPLARGVHPYLVLHVAAGSGLEKMPRWGGERWEGDASITMAQSV